MKILHVAVFTPNSTNIWQADGFEALGYEVIRYDYRHRPNHIKSINQRDDELIQLCQIKKPNMILFSKCNAMHYRVVKECRKIGKTIMWYMDGLENFDLEVIDKFKHSDFIFCAAQKCIPEAKKYCNNSFRHPSAGGFDSRIHHPVNIPKIRNVAFIGDVDNYVLSYRKKFKREVNFDIINGVYNEMHSITVSETKINLSFTEGTGVSNRLYKLLAAKGFVLTMPWDTMYEDFKPGKDFDIFNTPAELNKKIKYYLKNENEREAIALHGYKTVQKYNHINYAKFILKKMNNEKFKN